ncbi:MAG: hypothetical protein HYU69_05730 [Bacteroidetes bacterium]|nr:hypothetical protein [Bacteroidota bacterium]
MKKPDDLFLLIRSMSSNEKRYFKLFASIQKGDKNYIKLFEVIGRQKEYDEKEIKKKFSETVFIKQLTRIKNYLYELILKSLRVYHSGISVDMQLRTLLDNASVLYKKGLNESCRKMLTKAKKSAEKHERYPYIIDIHSWERKIFDGKIKHESGTGKELDDLFAAEQLAIKRLNIVNTYKHISSRTILYNKRSGNHENIKALKQIKLLLDSNKQTPATYEEKYFYYHCNSLYLKNTGKLKQSNELLKKSIAHMESHPELLAENLSRYFISLRSLMNYYGEHKQYSEALHYLQNFKQAAGQYGNRLDDRSRMVITYSLHEFEINLSIATGEFNSGIAIIPAIQKELQTLTQLPQDAKILLRFMYAYMYFGAGQYKKTIAWLNEIFEISNNVLRVDILSYAKILNLITHYELGNYELLPYIIKSTYRFLYKKNTLYKFERLALDFIEKKIRKINSSKELTIAFIALKTEVGKLIHDPNEKAALAYFDYISWLESKIQKQPFAEIVRKKALQKKTGPR